MPIFFAPRDYQRFIDAMAYYQIQEQKPRYSLFNPEMQSLNKENKLVEIVAYCLMPNHFHFLLKQCMDTGITEFLRKLTNSYGKYLNMKNKRVGPLFQGRFKSVHVETNEQLLHLSRYIHLNPIVSYITKEIESYPWSSYREYVLNPAGLCSKSIVLEQFKTSQDYKEFVDDQEDYGKELEYIKHHLLD